MTNTKNVSFSSNVSFASDPNSSFGDSTTSAATTTTARNVSFRATTTQRLTVLKKPISEATTPPTQQRLEDLVSSSAPTSLTQAPAPSSALPCTAALPTSTTTQVTPLYDWVSLATCHLFQGKQKHGLAFILYPAVVAWNAASTVGATEDLDIFALFLDADAIASFFVLVLNIFLFELANIGEAHDKGCHDYRCCPPSRSGRSNFFCAKGLARFWWLLFAVIQQLICIAIFGFFSVQQLQCLAVSIGTYIYTYGRGSRNTIYKAWFTAFLGGGAHPWAVSTVQRAGHWIHYGLFVCTPSMIGDCLSDCRDIEGDRKEGRRTLPMIFTDLLGGSEVRGRTAVCCVGFLSVAYLHFVAAATPLVLFNIFASTMCVLLPTLWPKTFKKKMWWDRKSLDIYYLTYVCWAGNVSLDSIQSICDRFSC